MVNFEWWQFARALSIALTAILVLWLFFWGKYALKRKSNLEELERSEEIKKRYK